MSEPSGDGDEAENAVAMPVPLGKDKKRRKCYSTSEKLEVIAFSKSVGKNSAARHFDVDRKTVREWVNQEDALRAQVEKGTN